MNIRAFFLSGWLVLHFVALARGQGSLTPPGAPAPTMKTLDQIEPRTAISSLPFTISAAGHYYVTRNLTTTGDGITVNADDVTIDLNGFSLSGDGGSGDIGVFIQSGRSRVRVKGGRIATFSVGVSLSVNNSEISLEDLHLYANGNGLIASATASGGVTRSVLRRVRASENLTSGLSFGNAGFVGIGQNVIDQCEMMNNGSTGLNVSTTGNLIVRCLASGNGTNYNIAAGNRLGALVSPTTNASLISGSTGGPGSGATDPFASLSF